MPSKIISHWYRAEIQGVRVQELYVATGNVELPASDSGLEKRFLTITCQGWATEVTDGVLGPVQSLLLSVMEKVAEKIDTEDELCEATQGHGSERGAKDENIR